MDDRFEKFVECCGLPETVKDASKFEDLIYGRDKTYTIPVVIGDNVEYFTVIPGHHIGSPIDPGPHHEADVMIVGKVPGPEETRLFMNFCGKSGDVLYAGLRNAGFTAKEWSSWYVCNACRYAVPYEMRNMLKVEHYKQFHKFFLYELYVVRPKVIVALGSEASRFVLGKSKSPSKSLGVTFDKTFKVCDEEISSKVIVVAHPAAVLHSESTRVLFQSGCRFLKTALDSVKTGVDPTPVYDTQLVTTTFDLDLFMSEVMSSDVIAMDLEWSGNRAWEPDSYIRLFAVYVPSTNRAWCVPGPAEIADYMSLTEKDIIKSMRSIMQAVKNGKLRIVGHNFRADMHWLLDSAKLFDMEDIPELWENIDDTMLMIHALHETGPFDLKTAASVFCGIPSWTEDLKNWKPSMNSSGNASSDKNDVYSQVPIDILYKYACGDVYATYRLYEYFNPINDGELTEFVTGIYEFEKSLQPALQRMERNGIGVDIERMERMRKAFKQAEKKLKEQLRSLLNWKDFNPRSPKQVAKALFNKNDNQINVQGLDVVELTESGAPSTSKSVLGILASKGNEVARLLLDYRYVDQALKMYLSASENSGLYRHVIDGRIYPSFSQTVETGRYACHNPNLQNISNQRESDYKRILGESYVGPIRSIFSAAPGYKLIEADLKGAELCVIAWLSQDETMIDHVSRNALPEDHPDYYDIHSAITVKAFKLNLEPTKKALEEAGLSSLRVTAKSIVFGRAYNRSAEAIKDQMESMGVNVTLDEIKRIIQEFDNTYPKAIEYLASLEKRVEDPGYIIAPSGRVRRFRDLSMSDHQAIEHAKREARNFPIQCTVADTMSKILFDLDSKVSEYGLEDDIRIVLQIHDALMLEVREDLVQDTIDLINALVKASPVIVTDPDHNLILDDNGKPLVYYFVPEIHVYTHWYEEEPVLNISN